MGWLGDGSHKGQGRQAWKAVDCRRGTWGYAPEGAFREVSDWIRACLSPGGGFLITPLSAIL